MFGTVEIGETDELTVGQKRRGVEALADRGVHLFFRQRVLRFREHEVQLLNALRKAAQGFDVVGRHWPVGKFMAALPLIVGVAKVMRARRVGMP